MLTHKQYDLLIFIDRRLREDGVSPSFDEMKDALGLRSKSGIHRLIISLEERGFIRRLAHRARALEVVRLPDNMKGETGQGPTSRRRAASGTAEGEKSSNSLLAGATADDGTPIVELPLHGRIAAGTPIEALRNETDFIDVPVSLMGRGEHFALEVAGDSMIDAGILDGDTVIVQRRDTAENGTIVVALVDNTEVTLKRYRRKGQNIALEPANSRYEIRVLPPERVTIQGSLVGLLRRY